MSRIVALVTLSIAFLAAAPLGAAPCAPPTLVHIVTVDVTAGIDSSSFGAQPKGLYRIGSDKMRLEEAPRSAKIHETYIVAEPNIWRVNLVNNYGVHSVDPGPTFNTLAPVFPMRGVSPKLQSLELGCESDFIAEYAPKPVRSERIGDVTFDVYRVSEGIDAVELLERPGTGVPSFARFYRSGILGKTLRYDEYSTNLPANPSLFTPPANVNFVEHER